MTQSETTPAVTRDLSGFLARRREQIAQRWAEAPRAVAGASPR